jgi:HEAT repeat protein
MARIRVIRLAAVVGLAAGLFGAVVADGVAAAGKKEEAQKYHEQLKTAKEAKKKVEALDELGKIGQVMKSLVTPAVPDIVKALEDKDAAVRAAAAENYGKCDPDPKDAVPALTKLLKEDKSDDVKIGATKGLAAMGDAAKPAVKDLQEVAKAGRGKDGKRTKLSQAASNAVRSINKKK